MLKDRFFIAYNYLTIVIWYGVILLISSIPDLDLKGSSLDWTLSSLGYALMYAFLFLLILRALLATFRLKVKRLMYFRSKGEGRGYRICPYNRTAHFPDCFSGSRPLFCL